MHQSKMLMSALNNRLRRMRCSSSKFEVLCLLRIALGAAYRIEAVAPPIFLFVLVGQCIQLSQHLLAVFGLARFTECRPIGRQGKPRSLIQVL